MNETETLSVKIEKVQAWEQRNEPTPGSIIHQHLQVVSQVGMWSTIPYGKSKFGIYLGNGFVVVAE